MSAPYGSGGSPSVPPGTPLPPTPQRGGAPSLADGEWHRMHPLTPLFKGGLVLIIVAGIVISNMRDRLVSWFVHLFAPQSGYYNDYSGGDPVDWVVANNGVLIALVAVLVLVVLLSAIFWFVWRFQQFRITGSDVEVRKGIVFRSHRRAPLDRVQGVNLTRPFPARLIGLAKIEVVGAGTDANVDLEYLSTTKAEAVRADILRLASGARSARLAAAAGVAPGAPITGAPVPGAPAGERRVEQFVGTVGEGFSGLIDGVDMADVAPESVVKIPTGRLIGSQLVAAVLWLLFFATIFVVAMVAVIIGALRDGSAEAAIGVTAVALGMGIPLVIAVVGVTWSQISKSLRYSIAPTPDGIRLTFGLLTTVTETLPPGRIFAVEVSQSLLWRPFGWWVVRINRMSGKSASAQQSGNAQQFNTVLPVGKRADVERVLALILPGATPEELAELWEHGVLGRKGGAYRTTPARAWWRHPLAWRRNGYAVSGLGLLLRRGALWRRLAIVPLARLQGISVTQGPLSRAQRIATAHAHSVTGPVSGRLSALDRDDAMVLIGEVAEAAVRAASEDHSHRWAHGATDAASGIAAPLSGTPGIGASVNEVPASGAPGSIASALPSAYPVSPSPNPQSPIPPFQVPPSSDGAR